ncbi:hypothetical protein [Streptomyces sp. SP17KL33]|uniref:hypothetical protein n=1 Tax=Streptomyces sp. SP17KL33 TaxID=3002534 RepID=UPI002E76A844|nr:hypothetical protein [Streptomyces sp. SP17KL33]MEE1838175.1 hypothetical protein [Streptomyces sp. SP17KL33]
MTTTATRTRITDAKRQPSDRAMKKVWLLENLIFHARTGAGERAAAERMLDRAIEAAREAGQIAEQSGGDKKAETWHGYRLPSVRYGEKYEEVKHMSLTEIAKRIREDIKLARKVAEKLGTGSEVALVDPLAALAAMPKQIKVSVTRDYFSGGGSIDVRVYNLPEKGWGYVQEKDYLGYDRWVPNAELKGILAALEQIHRAYNFDGSDAMVDYFHVNYYGHVEVDWRERP